MSPSDSSDSHFFAATASPEADGQQGWRAGPPGAVPAAGQAPSASMADEAPAADIGQRLVSCCCLNEGVDPALRQSPLLPAVQHGGAPPPQEM